MAGRETALKVILLGNGRVGKTSIVQRYITGHFDSRQPSTIQAACVQKSLLVNGKKVALTIWDTAGQERFHSMAAVYYRQTDGALLVFDLTDADSLTRVKQWVRELHKMVGDDVILTICGNKADLVGQRQVSRKQGEAYASSAGAVYFETSAMTDQGITEAFLSTTQRVVAAKALQGDDAAEEDDDFGLTVNWDEEVEPEQGGKCKC
ncbi:Ran GTPase [Kipferlia bialata]|uniref:Ran GTPase n=1 Tax=Kipferlia bialata TaxID=797122 RepID=A0A9K3GL44_9EUKA|nr:Ran GTPase [Kipferlia bialata]|eukprot:g8918.t1